MHYYTFHIGDWRKSTRGLTHLERGLYREMIDELCESEAPLPLDEEKLFDLLGVSKSAEMAAVRVILKKKFHSMDGGYIQPRAWAEVLSHREKHQHLSRIGKLGGVAKHKQAVAARLASASLPLSADPSTLSGAGSHKPLAISQEPQAISQEPALPAEAGAPGVCLSDSDWAELIRAAYPRNDSPMPCLQAILAELNTGQDPAEMLARVQACAAAIAKAPSGPNNRFVNKARSFFEERVWFDHQAFAQRLAEPEKKGGAGFSPSSFQASEAAPLGWRAAAHEVLGYTPEDWAALPAASKAEIREELRKSA